MNTANFGALLFFLVSTSVALTAQRQAINPTPASANPVYLNTPPEGLRHTGPLQNGGFRLLASRNDDWIQQSNQWQYRDSIVYLYDGPILQQAQTLRFDGHDWKIASREIYGYDLGNRTLSQRQTWDGSAWKDASRTVYQYDANSNRIFTINQNSNGTDWINVNLAMYTYDANGNLTRLRRQKYQGNGWIDQSLEVYEYDTSNLRTVQTKQIWNAPANAWVNTQKINYHYTPIKQVDQELLKIWKNETWEPSLLVSYAYQDSTLSEVSRANWTGFVWSNYSKEVYTYQQQAPHLLSALTTLLWQGSDWNNQERSACSYDANCNKVYQLRQIFVDGAWQNVEQSFSYYERLVSAPIQHALSADFQVSPNPGKGAFTLQYEHPDDKTASLAVMDQQGRQVAILTLSGQPIEHFDLRFLPNGAYWLLLRTEKGQLGSRQIQILR